MALGGFDEARVQQAHGAFGEAEHQVGAILEVHVQQRARQTRPLRHVIHGQRIQAHVATGRLRGIHDFSAASFLFLESAFGDIAHGPGA